MTEILDHAITVRDLLYVFVGAVGLVVAAGCAGALYLHRLDKKRAAFNRQMSDEHATYNLRNPAYGAPKDGIKWQDGRPYAAE
jgi:hypothetical protein